MIRREIDSAYAWRRLADRKGVILPVTTGRMIKASSPNIAVPVVVYASHIIKVLAAGGAFSVGTGQLVTDLDMMPIGIVTEP